MSGAQTSTMGSGEASDIHSAVLDDTSRSAGQATERISYDDRITRYFLWASVLWGCVGMLMGVVVALQLAMPEANLPPYFTFGRLRPVHTNAVIFAFVGNMLFAGIYYSTQRLLKARMAHDGLSWIHFWGWQAIIVAAAITLPLGFTQGKEYAELEWPIDIAIALIWVVFCINFFWTLALRREKQLYVALWFYIATLLTVAILHIVNSLVIPAGLFKSYSLFGGVQDALVQWWYGHNAVAFFLTTPILGIMYYYVPKAAERPVFSYRLSIVHFWALVFIYIWAGPHHLLNTALPDWAQSLGMVFSLMLWAPSWGGMINGLLTLRGAWDKLRRDPVLKFFAAAITFYGMSTFEGPLLSIKAVSSLAHYTDWIIAHVHGGGLGWNGFMAAGMFYWLVPRLYGTKLHSVSAANAHFYTGTFGILLYVGSMWAAGIQQGLDWMAINEDGGFKYSFLETVTRLNLLYWMRLVGGTVYLLGFIAMGVNLFLTARSGQAHDVEVEVRKREEKDAGPSWIRIVTAPPVVLTTVVTALVCVIAVLNAIASTLVIVMTAFVAVLGAIAVSASKETNVSRWHGILEGKALIFTVFTIIAVLIGGVLEILPMLVTQTQVASSTENVPYDAIELEGRDIYLAEGCYTCHSQMVRPFTYEVDRYGDKRPSTMDDSVFDHPFQWGSKRTGPDLAFEGGVRDDVWHYTHMIEPSRLSRGSVMPPYPHLVKETVNYENTATKMRSLRAAGVPYGPEQIATAKQAGLARGQAIADGLRESAEIDIASESKLVALIAYLQRLGRPPDALTTEEAEQVASFTARGEGGR